MKGVAALLALILLTAAAPARVTFVQQPDAAADLIGTQVLLQAGLDREAPSQNGLAALTAQTILRTPVSNIPLEDAVKAAGGSVSFVMAPGRVRFYLEGPASRYAVLQQLFSTALAHPDFTPSTVVAARVQLNKKIAADQRSPLRVGIEMLDRAFYQNSDAGLPRYGISETLAGFTAADVQAFYAAHYRAGDALVSSAGNTAAAGVSPAAIVQALPAGTSTAIVVRAAALPSTSRQLVARRDVPVPWLVAQYAAPAAGSKDFGAMLILTEFMQRTLSDVSDVPAIATRSAAESGVGAYYNFDSSPANVIVYVDGGLGDPVRTFSMALGVVGVLGHAKLGGDIAELKNFAAGRLLVDSQTVEQRAYLAALFARSGGNAQAQILKAIDATKAADLQRVAARYLNAPAIALVLPRSK
ncbi:MAG: M16 family metallopeptidase [Candidatus Baltobacteraceae bacterium]